MVKNFFFLAFICVLIGCQKDAVEIDNKEPVFSSKLSASSDYEELSSEVRDIIVNGGVGHFNCEKTSNKKGVRGGDLGVYEYPYLNTSPIKLYKSSLPCQPNIPYFIFSYVDSKKAGNSVTFRLVLNPSYFNLVKVVDINWELNGQNDSLPVGSFAINDLQTGESNSVTCRVFSTDDNLSVYSQEMTFDFEILQNLGTSPDIQFGSGYTYACTSTGIFPIIAP